MSRLISNCLFFSIDLIITNMCSMLFIYFLDSLAQPNHFICGKQNVWFVLQRKWTSEKAKRKDIYWINLYILVVSHTYICHQNSLQHNDSHFYNVLINPYASDWVSEHNSNINGIWSRQWNKTHTHIQSLFIPIC